MSMKIIYKCDICRDEKDKAQLMGCNFTTLNKFKLDKPQTTEGVHICNSCLMQIRDQMVSMTATYKQG